MNPRTTSRASLLRRRPRWTTMTLTSTRKSTPQVRRRADVLTLSIMRRRLLHRRHRRRRHRLHPSLLPVRRPLHRNHPHRPSLRLHLDPFHLHRHLRRPRRRRARSCRPTQTTPPRALCSSEQCIPRDLGGSVGLRWRERRRQERWRTASMTFGPNPARRTGDGRRTARRSRRMPVPMPPPSIRSRPLQPLFPSRP